MKTAPKVETRVKVTSPMALKKSHAVALLAAVMASGCSILDEAFAPSLSASDPAAIEVATPSVAAPPPVTATSTFQPVSVSAGATTGTFVGTKVAALRGDLQQLVNTITAQSAGLQAIRVETAQDSAKYHGTVAAINARLQVGTTPGNPILMQQWNAAQSELDKVNSDIIRMNQLATEVASSAAFANYLLDAVRAARTLSGAVDEDFRQLRILEDETQRTIVSVDRLLTELAGDIQRQQQYVATEKSDLNTLAVAIKNGQFYGAALSSRFAAAPNFVAPGLAPQGMMQAPMMPPQAMAAPVGDAPMMVIRFNRPNVAYEGPLYTAVKGALDRNPGATFDVVAVSPASGSAGQAALGSTSARRNAEAVVRSLTSMGLPAERIRLSAMTSSSASGGEVHVFSR